MPLQPTRPPGISRPPRNRRCVRLCVLALPLLASSVGIAAAQGKDNASPLPVRDVVLFSSGVGYFQHAGEVSGDTSLTFSFRTEQINDLLKSLVLFDPEGRVKPVTYTTDDPLARGLAGTGIDLNNAQSLAAILRQFQGALVRVTAAGGDTEGQIVSVSSQPVPVKEASVQIDVLNLLTADGLSAILLPEIKQIRLLDATLDKRFRDSLTLLASGLDKRRKTVSVNFGGDRRREVRMGYLLEAPVWKTSYRLVLDDKKPAPYLQGWAIVENTTDEDWKDVRLSLVSGRPVSFIQDLYSPIYIPRPVVQPQIIGSPLPQLHAGGLDEEQSKVALRSEMERLAGRDSPAAPATGIELNAGLQADGSSLGNRGMLEKDVRSRRRNIGDVVGKLAQSVASQATGEERGELFEYALAKPVTLPSHQAAMVPIVSSDLGGEKLSIFNPQVNATYPMNAVKVKNTSGLQLSGGPVTVYAGGIYAGDGQIDTLQPDEERLISYAVDLAVEGKYETKSAPQQTLSVRADGGVLHVTRKQRIEHDYTFKNKDDRPRVILVEQPLSPDWTLVQPAKADETTASLYRFRVTVPAKTTGTFEAVTEQPLTESIQIVDADINYLMTWAQNAQLSEKLRASLKQVVEYRRRITDLQNRRAQADNELKAIDAEQARIRENMKTLDKASPLYHQYVKKLTDQESRIDALRAEVNRLQNAENDAREELRKYLDGLKID